MLSDTGTLFTKSVQQYTKAPYNHTSLSFNKNLSDMYSFGRKNPHNPIIGGFIKEDVYYGTYRYFPKTTCAVFELKVSLRTMEKIRRIIQTFETNKNAYTYNLVGLVGIPLNVPISLKSSYFCSQFVAEVLKRAGLKMWDKPSALVTPEDFRTSEDITLIYEGPLYEYEPIRVRLPLYHLHKKRLSVRIKKYQQNLKLRSVGQMALGASTNLQLILPLKVNIKNRYENYRNNSINDKWMRQSRGKIEKIISWFLRKN